MKQEKLLKNVKNLYRFLIFFDSLVDTLFLRLLDLVMTTYTKNQRLITGNRVYDRALEVLDHI